MSEEITEYKKIVDGFVIQDYVKKNNKFVCNGQEFISGDKVDREDSNEEEITDKIDTKKEVYEPLEMIQPGVDYYYLFVWGCYDPQVIGPFESEFDMEENRQKKREKEREDKHIHIYLPFEVRKGVKVLFE